MIGQNYRLTEIQAAIGRAQLKKLDGLVAERQRNAEYLADRLGKLPGIRPAPTREGATHAYYMHAFFFDEDIVGVGRNRFIKAVQAELPASRMRESDGPLIVASGGKPLYLHPVFQKEIAFGSKGFPFKSEFYKGKTNYQKGICPVAERLYEKEMFFNELIRPGMSINDLDDVAKAFEKVYQLKEDIPK